MANEETPSELERALDAFEVGALDGIIENKRRRDFEALCRILCEEPATDPVRRQRAIYALGRWGDSSVVPDIVDALPRLKESHCITAIEALGRLGTKDARKAIERFADNPSPQVRKFVVKALSRIGGRAAEARLQKMVKEGRDDWVRDFAAKRMRAQADRNADKR